MVVLTRYGHVDPHEPIKVEHLDFCPEVKLQEPYNPVLPNIYVTEPPYQASEQEPRTIQLYVYENRPKSVYSFVNGRKVVNLPPHHC